MRLFLIRHAESEHNVAQKLAGITDSRLTNHGVLQTQRLGAYLTKSGFIFRKIFTSDLQRAKITAATICDSQQGQGWHVMPTFTPLLREQDFGFYEGKPWTLRLPDEIAPGDPRTDPSFQDKETQESIAVRTNRFLDEHLLPLILPEVGNNQGDEQDIAVVSHGVTLSVLWRCLLLRFGPNSVLVGPEVGTNRGFRGLEYLPGWSNTGYLELEIRPLTTAIPTTMSASTISTNNINDEAIESAAIVRETSPVAPIPVNEQISNVQLSDWGMVIKTINGKQHLSDLRRTGGGVGSTTHDTRQQKVDNYFKKDTSK